MNDYTFSGYAYVYRHPHIYNSYYKQGNILVSSESLLCLFNNVTYYTGPNR